MEDLRKTYKAAYDNVKSLEKGNKLREPIKKQLEAKIKKWEKIPKDKLKANQKTSLAKAKDDLKKINSQITSIDKALKTAKENEKKTGEAFKKEANRIAAEDKKKVDAKGDKERNANEAKESYQGLLYRIRQLMFIKDTNITLIAKYQKECDHFAYALKNGQKKDLITKKQVKNITGQLKQSTELLDSATDKLDYVDNQIKECKKNCSKFQKTLEDATGKKLGSIDDNLNKNVIQLNNCDRKDFEALGYFFTKLDGKFQARKNRSIVTGKSENEVIEHLQGMVII